MQGWRGDQDEEIGMKLTSDNGRGYRCPFCLAKFRSARQLARHLTYTNCKPKVKVKR
jgi:hypothetical protein